MAEDFCTSNVASNNKRILKGTMILYFRMFFIMFVSFFTTRELLGALGTEDFGLTNVIGGLVAMFVVISSVMSTTISRFFNYEIGQNNYAQLKKLFSLTLEVYGMIFIVCLILLETAGLWFFNTNIVISPDKRESALYFFHFSTASILLGILAIPYISLLISHEDIQHFSWVSVGEVIGKLLIVYMLVFYPTHKLAHYGFLLMLVSAFKLAALWIICRIRHPESKFSFYWDFKLCKQMLHFSSATFMGSCSNYLSNVFVNIFLNNYCGAVANTARAISFQVAVGIVSVCHNLNSASFPQITKYWAAKDFEKSKKLTLAVSRLGFFLLFLFSLPLFAECEYVFSIWLGKVPEYSIYFTRLFIIQILITSFIFPMTALVGAQGNITMFHFTIGLINFLNIPMAYLFLRAGAPAISVMYIAVGLEVARLLAGVILLEKLVGVSAKSYLLNFGKIFLVIIISTIPIVLLSYLMTDGFFRFCLNLFLSISIVSTSAYILGLNNNERNMVKNSIRQFVQRKIFHRQFRHD